jgi:murein DD-endopeptidase MepM/ murein hydrolase activator NlpD
MDGQVLEPLGIIGIREGRLIEAVVGWWCRMGRPRARRAFARTLISPPVAMIAVACFGVLLQSNTRVDHQGTASVLAPDWVQTREAALAHGLSEPEAVLALSLPSSLGAVGPAVIGDNPIVVAAAIRPERSLIDVIALMSSGVGDADPSQFVGPPDPGPRPSNGSAMAAVAACAANDDESSRVCDETGDDALVSAEAPGQWRDWNDGRFVGPQVPAGSICKDFDGTAFVGPSRPQPVVPVAQNTVTLRNYDGDAFVGPPAPALRDYDGDAFVGPILPADRDDYAGHRPHGLPFKPLDEPAFHDGSETVGADSSADLAAILAEVEEYHTVRYVHEVAHKVASGETLSEVLSEVGGLSNREVEQWLSAAREHYNPNKVYAGQVISLLLDMPEGRARRMKLESSRDSIVIVEAEVSGVSSRKEDIPYEHNIRVVSGTIENSLYVDAVKHGLPEKVIAEMAEILGWDINFGRDLRSGAEYRVAYEELTRLDTLASRAGRVMAVEVENRDKRYEGFYFAKPDGSDGGYFNRKGEGLGRAFLRYPVAFNRISSHFSTKRFHPVLKRNVPHYGVDFAAATGTPVKAVADGVISKAGWFGGNGRFVKMRHDSVYESGYAHLSKIPSGIRAGVHVKQGQIIGYVGSTGLATGPHLHYAMYRSGKYIDPLRAGLPRRRSLSGNELARFEAQRDRVDAEYAKHASERVEVARASVEVSDSEKVASD